MSYIVNLPDGQLLTTILDGTIDTSASSLTLVGRNYSGYGEIIAEDLVALLVNFSNNVSPNNPNTGQIWYDSGNKLVKVYTGSAWKNVGSATYSSTAPSTTIGGDFWWHSINKQLYCYDGTSPYDAAGWILVGPGYPTPSGKSGALYEQISDGTVSHDVVSIYLNGTRTAIISQDQFTPNVSISGFTSIQVGYNMTTTSTNGTIWGTANNASYLGAQPAANYFRNNQNNSGTGNLTILNNSGVTIGAYNNANLTIDSANTLVLWNSISNTDIDLYATTGGTKTRYLHIDGTNGYVEVGVDPVTPDGITSNRYVDANIVLKANIASPTLTGNPQAPTPADSDNSVSIATTAFVQGANLALKGYSDNFRDILDGNIVLKANIASPTLTGLPRSVTMNPGSANTTIATTAFVYEANVAMTNYVDNKFNDTVLYGVPTADTAPAGTANSMVATTAFVVNNSGFFSYKIYQNNTHIWVNDSGTGSANIVIDGTTVLTAASSGVVLNNGATASTQGQTYNTTGNTLIATTQFAKTATTWWGGSAKFVSNAAPNPGVNDIGSNNGDFWFQYAE
jgi:hypothetical protein